MAAGRDSGVRQVRDAIGLVDRRPLFRPPCHVKVIL